MRILLNCAVDRAGRVAGPAGEPARISTVADLRRVHALRASCDAILVGVGTVLRDDPHLRVKAEFAEGPDPVPVVLDSSLRTPAAALVLSPRTLIYHVAGGKSPGGTCVRVPAGLGGVELAAVLGDLRQRGLQSVLVEGGPTVLRSFVRAGLWDRWTVFQAALDLQDGPALWDELPNEDGGDGVACIGREDALGGTLWTFSPA